MGMTDLEAIRAERDKALAILDEMIEDGETKLADALEADREALKIKIKLLRARRASIALAAAVKANSSQQMADAVAELKGITAKMTETAARMVTVTDFIGQASALARSGVAVIGFFKSGAG
jgi:septal ring factor EnvC (AmiA/AmiB activator)